MREGIQDVQCMTKHLQYMEICYDTIKEEDNDTDKIAISWMPTYAE